MEAGDKPDKWRKTATTSRDSPHRGHGEVSLAQEGDWRMIVRKGKVEIGNSGLIVFSRSSLWEVYSP